MPRDMRWKQLMHILGEINGAYHDASVKMGLADSEMQILYSVHMAEGKLYPSEIARLCGMSRQTVASALRSLESEGILYLETGAGRSRPVRLTQAGEELCRERVAPVAAAEEARRQGLGLNAGHDLSLENLRYFVSRIPWTDEVSIGHALICDALYYGLENTVQLYRRELKL